MLLSRALRASRRSWRAITPDQVALSSFQGPTTGAVWSARLYSSSGAAGGDAGSEDALAEEAKPTSWGKHYKRSAAWEEKVLSALRAYKEIKGDALVPQTFVVPSGEIRWPRAAWGYRLGRGAALVRIQAGKQALSPNMIAQLEELDFVYEPVQHRWDEIIMPALRHFYKVHDHTDVPMDFVVPSDDKTWPEKSWGLKLGATINGIRSRASYAVQVAASEEELNRIKFCSTSIFDRDWTEKVLASLGVFRRLNHHCIVERPFKVPSEQPWPEPAWGMALGQVVNHIRKGKYSAHVAVDQNLLDRLGFAQNRDVATWNERIIPGLEVFVAEYGHCNVSCKFSVPAKDPWPKSAWDLKLGSVLSNMRSSGTYFGITGRDVDRLMELGYSFKLGTRPWNQYVEPLLDTFATVFGSTEVPHDFVVPSEAPWPEEMWGVHLGVFVARNAKYRTTS